MRRVVILLRTEYLLGENVCNALKNISKNLHFMIDSGLHKYATRVEKVAETKGTRFLG